MPASSKPPQGLGRLEVKLRQLLLQSGGAQEAVDYVVSTLLSELGADLGDGEEDDGGDREEELEDQAGDDEEEEEDDNEEAPDASGSGICCSEDVFGVLQAFVPEEMLATGLGVEDDDDMEVLVGKLWALLLKEKAVRDPEEEEGEGSHGRGGCELCGRDMPLTRHHLRPRSTHRKFLKQGLSQDVLNTCADICRPCHSAVHRSHDNDTLGQEFFTVERLLADEKVARFVAWVSKVKPRSRSDGHNQKLRYRR